MLLTSTTQPMYDAAREANGPEVKGTGDASESVVVVGQMTRRIGKSLVQLDTRRAVEIADGVARPGRGALGS